MLTIKQIYIFYFWIKQKPNGKRKLRKKPTVQINKKIN